MKPKSRIYFHLLIFTLIIASIFASTEKVSANILCSPKGYTILTINGVFAKDKRSARTNAYALERKFNSPTFHNQPVYFDYLYNPSHLGGLGDILDSIDQGVFDKEFYEDFDLMSLLKQASKKIKTQKVLLVGHSQGNFYANSFYDFVTSRKGGIPSQSIGIYSVATPSSRVAGGGKYITSDTDEVINAVRKVNFLEKVLPPNTHIEIQKGDDKLGHSFTDIYLKYKSSRIISDIENSLSKLKSDNIRNNQKSCFIPRFTNLEEKSYSFQYPILLVGDLVANGAKQAIIFSVKTANFVALKVEKTIKVATQKAIMKVTVSLIKLEDAIIKGADLFAKAAIYTAKKIEQGAKKISNSLNKIGSDLKSNFLESLSGIPREELIAVFPTSRIDQENFQFNKQKSRNETENQKTKKPEETVTKSEIHFQSSPKAKTISKQIQKPTNSNLLTYEVNRLEFSSFPKIIGENDKSKQENKIKITESKIKKNKIVENKITENKAKENKTKKDNSRKITESNKQTCFPQSIDLNRASQEELEKIVGIGLS